nr:LIM domain-containing protein [Ipomoea batatas]
MKQRSMSPKTLDPRRAIENCIFHLHSWRPFQVQSKTLDSSDSAKPYAAQGNGFFSKRPCRADRATAFPIDALDMSKLSLFDEDRPLSAHKRDSGIRWIARKRRRRGSRSVSGRSSDRSGTRLRCCSVGASAACGTCSDFPMAPGTDSSGELFVNGDVNWASDVSNESGYGSEPGYRGDGEIGYGDEFDEEEDDQRLLFWGHEFGGNYTVNNWCYIFKSEPTKLLLNADLSLVYSAASKAEKMGKNALQKAHHRCRRRKHDIKMVDLMT